MYDGCFGLTRRPFVSVPQVDQYFPARQLKSDEPRWPAVSSAGEGAGLVIGPSGTGKTLLCLMLAEQFRRSFQVAMLSSGRLSTRRALFQAILYELGRPYRGMDEGELRLAVVDHLDGRRRQLRAAWCCWWMRPIRCRFVCWKKSGCLTNLARNGQPLVRLVLAGRPPWKSGWPAPSSTRSASGSVGPLLSRCAQSHGNAGVHSMADQLRRAGMGEQVFPEAACQSVFQATGGVPRLINQVCDHALLLAYVAGRQTVEPADIEEAWADLQQLPTPCDGGRTATSGRRRRDRVRLAGRFGRRRPSRPERPSTAPAVFRVLRSSKTRAEATAEPAEQIHRIERLLAEADDDFQPAGSIGPEIELYFEETPHPFQEEFEHEEIVADRYAAKASGGDSETKCAATTCPPEPELVSAAVVASAGDSFVADEPPGAI